MAHCWILCKGLLKEQKHSTVHPQTSHHLLQLCITGGTTLSFHDFVLFFSYSAISLPACDGVETCPQHVTPPRSPPVAPLRTKRVRCKVTEFHSRFCRRAHLCFYDKSPHPSPGCLRLLRNNSPFLDSFSHCLFMAGMYSGPHSDHVVTSLRRKDPSVGGRGNVKAALSSEGHMVNCPDKRRWITFNSPKQRDSSRKKWPKKLIHGH